MNIRQDGDYSDAEILENLMNVFSIYQNPYSFIICGSGLRVSFRFGSFKVDSQLGV